jgi:adenylate cyclase
MADGQRRSGARLRLALFLGVGLAATGLGLITYGTSLFRGLDLDTVDVRFSIRGEQDPPADLVVVRIDDVSFDELNERWPFRRTLHARLIRKLKSEGAKVIAYDVQFSEPSINPDGSIAYRQDNAFMDSARAAGNLVFSTTEVNENNEPNFLGGQEGVDYARARVGNGNYDGDPGGVIRRAQFELDGLETFAVAAAERVTGRQVSPFSGEEKLIDFKGPAGSVEAVSFSRVLSGRFPDGLFRDQIVIVGAWAPSLQDVHPTSFGTDEMPGPEIQANAIATILRGLPLEFVPSWLNFALIVFLGLLAPLASLKLNLFRTLLLAVSAAALYIGATIFAFNQGYVLSFVYPFGSLVLASVGALGAHYLLAAFERERVRDVFSRFVPESVVEQVLARTDKDLRLGGVSIVGSIMFTDLRGFTTFSESLPADRVIQAVNYYLSEMTDAIHAHEGTLVSYEGDGIMAVFGAPIEQEDHADRAVSTAREMLDVRLPRFNAWLREQELGEGFKMGIGVNTGAFMSGNVGSERRLEYTVIGDATNTASRLQGMTKGQAYLFYMADSTREALIEEVDDLVFVDEFEVRGRQEKVKIWSVEAANSEAFDAREAEVRSREKG